MDILGSGRPLETGAPAPDFTLTMVQPEERPVSLAGYRGKTPLLLGLYRGVYCAFCRRAVARLGRSGDRLRPLGIEMLAVIGPTLGNAEAIVRHRHPWNRGSSFSLTRRGLARRSSDMRGTTFGYRCG